MLKNYLTFETICGEFHQVKNNTRREFNFVNIEILSGALQKSYRIYKN